MRILIVDYKCILVMLIKNEELQKWIINDDFKSRFQIYISNVAYKCGLKMWIIG